MAEFKEEHAVAILVENFSWTKEEIEEMLLGSDELSAFLKALNDIYHVLED